MKTNINIENYEEIMFRLVEDDIDESTRIDLLRQIESDALFKFEWESWQKTKFVDPLENYAIESSELTEKIILIAEPQTTGRKRFFYYWAAAASILVLIASVFLWIADFKSSPKQNITELVSKPQTPVKNLIAPVQNDTESITITERKQARNHRIENTSILAVADSNTNVPTENTLAEIPNLIDSIPVKTNELAKAPEKRQRYTITIETSEIAGINQNNNDLAQNRRGKIGKIFTNTQFVLKRKISGDPDKIILFGDESSYLCINLNY